MNEQDRLAERFEEHRTHLRAVAYRMLGSVREADDAVQRFGPDVPRRPRLNCPV
jgi:DNA-directed RNA polymerase specialized sigma24 family protein